ncbi:hypothetical protein [Bacillus sp. AFS040349]|uniref:hypothetical protein n=1 Tax=Bacillus sp. AFS040349 TaxID=2033502 RepID=UPI000BFB66C5|nr:hypothetical protein [Bacillus sp. AFS040349]PGT75012.1 hypothetical protein COD11_26165 [Bacillus sp. AFS040349]
MEKVKSVILDGEEIRVFNSAIYLFETNTTVTLEVNIIVSEIVASKYKHVDNLIVEIELEDGRMINSIMSVTVMQGRLPQLHIFCDIDDFDEYKGLSILNESNSSFPDIEEGITLEEIRKVEMPLEDITLKLKLPIDKVEWLRKLKKKEVTDMMEEFLIYYRKKG